MPLSHRIAVDPAVGFGRPSVRGTHLTVGDVLGYLASRERRLMSVPAA